MCVDSKRNIHLRANRSSGRLIGTKSHLDLTGRRSGESSSYSNLTWTEIPEIWDPKTNPRQRQTFVYKGVFLEIFQGMLSKTKTPKFLAKIFSFLEHFLSQS